jgi:hypothetical protein
MVIVCTKCKKEKNQSDFYANKSKPSGFNSECKACGIEQKRIRNLLDSDYKNKVSRWNISSYPRIKEWRKNLKETNPLLWKFRERKWALKKNYGITPEDYLAMFIQQEGLCACCRNPPKEGKILCVDHCHQTNKIRGLLCESCNLVLGKVKDNTFTLKNMIKYLRKNNDNSNEF